MSMKTCQHIRVRPEAGGPDGWGEELPLAGQRGRHFLDLSALRFVEPLFLLRLAAALDRFASSGTLLGVRLPDIPDVREYLSWMDVNGPLPTEARIPLPDIGLRDRSDVLVPVTRLRDVQSIDSLTHQLAQVMDAHFTGRLQPMVSPVLVAVTELCENATTHGANPLGAWVAVQRYKPGRCVVGIGDLGVGIPKHIRQTVRALPDDGAAIARATQKGTTGTYEDRGNGYSGLLSKLRTSGVPRARLRIWSGGGRFTVSVRPERTVHRLGRPVDAKTDGTWIGLDLETC